MGVEFGEFVGKGRRVGGLEFALGIAGETRDEDVQHQKFKLGKVGRMFGHKENGAPDYAPVPAWMVWLLARRADFHSGGPLAVFGAFKTGTGNGTAVNGEGSGKQKQTELFHAALVEGFDPLNTGLHAVLRIVLDRRDEHHFAADQRTEIQRAGTSAVIGASDAIIQASHADAEVRCRRVVRLL